VPITLHFIRSVEGIFAELGPYDPSANGSIGDWIGAGLLFFFALFFWFIFFVLIWEHPVHQLKAMRNFREERNESLPTSHTLDSWPLAVSGHNLNRLCSFSAGHEDKNGSRILFNLPLCSKTEYEEKVCRAFQNTSCAVTVTLPIAMAYMVFVRAFFSVLIPYSLLSMDFGVGDSIFDWILVWVTIAFITFLMGIPTALLWVIIPLDDIKRH
jgi:hypothetical protein